MFADTHTLDQALRKGITEASIDAAVHSLDLQCKDIIEKSDFTTDELKDLSNELLSKAERHRDTSTSLAVAAQTPAAVTQSTGMHRINTIRDAENHASEHLDRTLLLSEIRNKLSVCDIAHARIPQQYFADKSTFSWTANLVPNSCSFLWQDVDPSIPFRELFSQEARNLLSIARVYSHYRESRKYTADSTGRNTSVPCYSHISGMINHSGRYIADDMGLYGIVLARDDAKARIFKMKWKEEKDAAQQCVDWLQK